MAISNGLCTLSDVKQAMNVFDSVDDVRIELAIEAASRMIEAQCNRRFYKDANASARTFVATNPALVLCDDFYTATGLVVRTDTGMDGTFAQTWTSADYQLEPLNQIIDGQPWAWTQIRAIEGLEFPMFYGQALVQVTAKWGWDAVPSAVKQAAIIQAITIFKSVEAPFGSLGVIETGVLNLRRGLHPTAALLVGPYRRDPVLVS